MRVEPRAETQHAHHHKKVLANGEDCRKCKEVRQRLEQGGYLPRIHRTLVADERDPNSAGWMVAAQYGVRPRRSSWFATTTGANRSTPCS